VLLSAEGLKKAEIAELTGASRVKVDRWRDRYAERGLAGLADIKRPGRPRSLDHAAIVTQTLKPPPHAAWPHRHARLGPQAPDID
jgi:transposase